MDFHISFPDGQRYGACTLILLIVLFTHPVQLSIGNQDELTSFSLDTFLLPVTHIVAKASAGPQLDIASTLDTFATLDDVWTPAFGKSKTFYHTFLLHST
jgi:hypothetical protein